MHIDYVATYNHMTLDWLSIYLNTDNTWKAIGSWGCLGDAENVDTNTFVCHNGFPESDSVHCNSLKSNVCIWITFALTTNLCQMYLLKD